MKTNEQISKIIQDNYPSRGNIKEPNLEVFTSGELYTGDPDFWEKSRQVFLKIGELAEETDRKIKEWDEENLPNLLWLQKLRLFVSNKIFLNDDRGELIEIEFSKLNFALLLFFLNHNGYIDKTDLTNAKEEIQSIYTSLGREELKQIKEREIDVLYRDNDWFNKLVSAFNSDPDWGVPEEEWKKKKKCPDDYGIKIFTRNAKHDFHRSKNHDYELHIPFEVHLGKEALKNFKAELNKRKKDIERERTLVNPISEQRQRFWDAAQGRAINNGMIESALKLGNAFSQKKPSEFEKWYRNDNLRRIILSYETKQYYMVQNGKKMPITLPAQQLSFVILLARHKEGLTLRQIRKDSTIVEELNNIYHSVKRSDKKDFVLDTLDESHPNAKLLDLITRIRKSGISIVKEFEGNGKYCVSGIYELIELP